MDFLICDTEGMTPPSSPAPNERLLRNVDALTRKLGLTDRALSLKINGKPDLIRSMRKRGHLPQGKNLENMATALGTSVDKLLNADEITTPSAAPQNNQPPAEIRLSERRIEWEAPIPDKNGIPLVGTGHCADLSVTESDSGDQVEIDQAQFEPDFHVRYIPHPPALIGARDLYAVYFAGDSMMPRYEAGEVAIIDPRRPVGAGDYVLVQLNDGTTDAPNSVIAKRLIRQNSQEVELEQFNPPLKFTIPRARIVHIHRIVPQTDLLFG